MTKGGCEVGFVSHRLASPPPPLLTTQTDSFTNKNRRKNIYEIKKRIYEKDPLNCWYSIQNRIKQNRITKSKQTFFDFFLKTGVTFPIFSSLIYETRLVAVAERHTRSDCGIYLLDTIYMYQIYRGTHRGAPLCVFTIQSTLFHSIFESRICK